MFIIFLRTVILYLFIVGAIRVMGKRQLGELQPSELVVAILIAELASIPMQDHGLPLLIGIIPIVTLVCLEVLFSGALLKSVKLRLVVNGKPSIVMQDGRIIRRELARNRLTIDELIEELRQQNVINIAAVKYAILETGGRLSVVQYKNAEAAATPPGAPALNDEELPLIIINDGRTMTHNMALLGMREPQLAEQIRKYGANGVRDVFLLMADKNGGTFFQHRDAAV